MLKIETVVQWLSAIYSLKEKFCLLSIILHSSKARKCECWLFNIYHDCALSLLFMPQSFSSGAMVKENDLDDFLSSYVSGSMWKPAVRTDLWCIFLIIMGTSYVPSFHNAHGTSLFWQSFHHQFNWKFIP